MLRERSLRLSKRIKSFCGAKPTQKLRWTERGGGWLRRPGLWNFQTRIGAKEALGGAVGRPVAAVKCPLCRWIAGARGWRRSCFAVKPCGWKRRATNVHGPLDAGDRSFSVGEWGWAAERLGAARQYVGDGATMRRRHRRAMSR